MTIEIQKKLPVTVDGRVIPGLRVEPTSGSIFIGGGLYYNVYVNDELIASAVSESAIEVWASIIDKIIPLAIAAEKFRDR